MAKKTPIHRKAVGEPGKMDFLGLRLIESASKLGDLKKNELPGHATQAINVAIGVREDSQTAGVNIRIKLTVGYDGDQTRDPALTVLGSFVADFSIIEPFSSKKMMEDFLGKVGMLVIWPYWREYVQSMTTRMGLPAFPVPLIKLSDIVQEKKD